MRAMPSGQYLPLDGPLHRLRAEVKLAGLLPMLVAVTMTRSLLGFGVLAALLALLIAVSRCGFAAILAPIGRIWTFLLVIFAMNALFFAGEDAVWSWWIFRVAPVGIWQGATIVLRVVLMLALTNLVTTTTPPMALTAALGRMLRPLKLLGVPVEAVAMILGVALRFIPILMEEADLIRMAQTARGARFESKHFWQRAESFFPLVIPIFLSAFRRADELSVAMEARGYELKEKQEGKK